MKKKVLVIAIMFAMIFAFSACGGGEGSSDSQESGKAEAGIMGESAEAHRGIAPTAKRTPETGASHACSEAEFPEAHGGAVKRLVLRAFEDVRSCFCLRFPFTKKKAGALLRLRFPVITSGRTCS